MIEFREGDDFCRWNGILMTPEKCKELFGIENEIEKAAENVWYYDEWIYSDRPFGETLKLFGIEKIDDSYYGSKKPIAFLYRVDFLDSTKGIKPIENFFIDYPDFNVFKYNEFWNELNEYYRSRFSDTVDFIRDSELHNLI